MANNQTINISGIASGTSFGTAALWLRTYFSLHHIRAAAHFARLSKRAESTYSGTFDDELFNEHRAYVTGSIILATSFLEATINELFSDAREGTAEQIKQLDSDTVNLLSNVWELSKAGSFSILEKYQLALTLAKKPLFNKGIAPYQSTHLLITLRNALAHYKPGWAGVDIDLHKWEGQLRAAGFTLNPMMPNNPFFPDRCLSHGCAKWAVETSLGFVREFCAVMNITPLFDKAAVNLATE